MRPPGWPLPLLGALLCLAAAHAAAAAPNWCVFDREERQGGLLKTRQLAVYSCPAISPVLLFPFLWQPVRVTVQCPSTRNSVHAAGDLEGLRKKVKDNEAVWCGLSSLLQGRECHLQLSPFATTLVGVSSDKECNVTSEAAPDYLMLASSLASLLLFYTAPALSTSVVFRLSCGSALFTAGSLLVLAYFISKLVPHKRSVTALLVATGSSGVAAARWLTGQWLPSLHQLLSNRAYLAYVVVSAGAGAAATYVYDDRSNPRVNTLIKAFLRVAGLCLMYHGTWTFWPFSACCLGLMVTSLTGPTVARSVHASTVHVHAAVSSAIKLARTPFTRRRTPARPATPATGARPPTPRVVDFDAAAPPTPRALEGLTPLHLRTPAPDPADVVPRRRVHTFEETMVKSLVRRGAGASGSRGGAGAGSTSLSPQVPGSGGARGRGSSASVGAGGAGTSAGAGAGAGVSPLVRKGLILNAATGRTIKVGGDTYNRLLAEGYVVDAAKGEMVAP